VDQKGTERRVNTIGCNDRSEIREEPEGIVIDIFVRHPKTVTETNKVKSSARKVYLVPFLPWARVTFGAEFTHGRRRRKPGEKR